MRLVFPLSVARGQLCFRHKPTTNSTVRTNVPPVVLHGQQHAAGGVFEMRQLARQTAVGPRVLELATAPARARLGMRCWRLGFALFPGTKVHSRMFVGAVLLNALQVDEVFERRNSQDIVVHVSIDLFDWAFAFSIVFESAVFAHRHARDRPAFQAEERQTVFRIGGMVPAHFVLKRHFDEHSRPGRIDVLGSVCLVVLQECCDAPFFLLVARRRWPGRAGDDRLFVDVWKSQKRWRVGGCDRRKGVGAFECAGVVGGAGVMGKTADVRCWHGGHGGVGGGLGVIVELGERLRQGRQGLLLAETADNVDRERGGGGGDENVWKVG
jgi:hypothetical protein